MSVINQMLNQLEQRGAHATLEQAQVRAVPQTKRKLAVSWWILSGLVLSVGFAAWQWLPLRKPGVAMPKAAQLPIVVSQALSASAVPANLPQAEPLDEISEPALRLSFELGSVPLPAVPRQVDGQTWHTADNVPDAGNAVVSGSTPDNKSNQIPRQFTRERADTPAKTRSAGQSSSAVPMKQVSAAQLADAEFAKAAAYMQQGRIAEAIAGYEATLQHDANHDVARQTLVALLLEGKRGADAERVLQGGLSRRPEHTGFAMLLARLQVEHGAVEQATATLAKSLPYADAQADFQAFFAALLQRQNRHKEAINHYQIALQLTPSNGVWLMGIGISLQAVQRSVDARDAYQRALDSNTLSPNLQAFVQQKLKGL